MSNFGDIFKELRVKRGVSQDVIADYLGKKRATVSNYENGNTEPTFEDLLKIADFFNVTVDYLLGRENAEKHYIDTKPDPLQEKFFNQLKAAIMSNGTEITEEALKQITDDELKHIAEFSKYIVNRDRPKK